MFGADAITLLWVEIKDAIESWSEQEVISPRASLEGVMTAPAFEGVIA